MKSVYFLLLCLVVTGNTAPIHLQIYNSQYVKICCGEPCQTLTFLLNRTLSAIHLHNTNFIAQSRTYYRSQSGTEDREYFQLHSVRYRWNVHLAPPAFTVQTKDSLPIDGTLGLGPGSPLWEHWENYTLSSQRLVLGGYDYFSQYDHNQRPPIVDTTQPVYVELGDKTILPMDLSIYSLETYLPYPMSVSSALGSVKITNEDCAGQYYEILRGTPVHCQDTNVLKPNLVQSVELANGAEYSAVKYTSRHVFVPGARFFEEFFWFESITTNQLIITQDAFCMDYNSVTAYSSIFITLFLGFWCHIAQSKTERKDSFEFFFAQMAEAACYLIDAVVLWVMFGMLNWDRYLAHYTLSNSHFAQTYIIIVCSLALLNWLYGLYTVPNYDAYRKRFKRTGLFHSVLFVSSQLLIVWLCFIKQHDASFERMAAAIILAVAMVHQLVATLWFWLSRQWLYMGLCASLLVTTNVLNILYTLKPIFYYSDFREQFGSFCLVWIYLTELTPALVILISAYTMQFRSRLPQKS